MTSTPTDILVADLAKHFGVCQSTISHLTTGLKRSLDRCGLEIAPAHKRDDAITIALNCGGIDGAHHKQWVIDQMLRLLAGDNYKELIDENWDEGIEP